MNLIINLLIWIDNMPKNIGYLKFKCQELFTINNKIVGMISNLKDSENKEVLRGMQYCLASSISILSDLIKHVENEMPYSIDEDY